MSFYVYVYKKLRTDNDNTSLNDSKCIDLSKDDESIFDDFC